MIVKRNYDWDDSQMLERAYYFYENLINDFTLFHISFTAFDDTFLNRFESSMRKVTQIPTDIEMSKEISAITIDIEILMAEARKLIQKLFIYVKAAYIHDKTILKNFGKSDFEKARNNKIFMINLLEKVNKLANSTEHHDNLINSGFSKIDIKNLNQLYEELKNIIKHRERTKKLRQLTTKERIHCYNKVWSFIEQISNASKVVFNDQPDKIKQYLLYPSINNLPFKIQNLTFNEDLNSMCWDKSKNSEFYELYQKPYDNSRDWEKIYSGHNNQFILNNNTGDYLYRCRGLNVFGFGYWSDIVLSKKQITDNVLVD